MFFIRMTRNTVLAHMDELCELFELLSGLTC